MLWTATDTPELRPSVCITPPSAALVGAPRLFSRWISLMVSLVLSVCILHFVLSCKKPCKCLVPLAPVSVPYIQYEQLRSKNRLHFSSIASVQLLSVKTQSRHGTALVLWSRGIFVMRYLCSLSLLAHIPHRPLQSTNTLYDKH